MNRMIKSKTTRISKEAFHPGEYLKEEIEARNMSQQELADKTQISKSEISQVIHGHRNLNVRLALLLEKVLEIDAEIWMNLQIKYDIAFMKQKVAISAKTIRK